MKDDKDKEGEIIKVWQESAAPWVDLILRKGIENRALVTDDAIVDAVLKCKPTTVIDLGCGEGWLTDTLTQQGIQVIGIDAVAELIDSARTLRRGQFIQASYAELLEENVSECADLVVCNFSFLGEGSVEQAVEVAATRLSGAGYLVVQTLHPVAACGDMPYEDGWREGTWCGFGSEFSDPAPWYFRTIESWTALFMRYGFSLCEQLEPLHPVSHLPASMIFIARLDVTKST